MNPDAFVKVFDILDTGYRTWTFPAFGLIFVAVGTTLLVLPRVLRALGIPYLHSPSRWQRVFPVIFLGFALFWTVATFLMTYASFLSHWMLARDNSCHMVEGPVENFVPMPYSGHAEESFTVRGVRFGYSDYAVTAGFNNTASHGGPITADGYVRICYAPGSNTILRLEIRGFAGAAKDYTKPMQMFPDAEDVRRVNQDYPEFDMPWHGSLFMVAYVLDFIGIYALFLPYLRTFFRLKTLPVTAQAIPTRLIPNTRVRLSNSLLYWDRHNMTIWLRPRGFILFQATQMAATLNIDPRRGSIVSADLRLSSGFVVAMALFGWAVYQMFVALPHATGKFQVPMPFLGVVAVMFLVGGFFGIRKLMASTQQLVQDALGEVGRM